MYFDQSATYPINQNVLKKTFEDIDMFYNSNSKHQKGFKANHIIKKSQQEFQDFFQLPNAEIIFTSGASESNNMVLLGLGKNHRKGTIIISPFEHSSILKPISYLQHLKHRIKIAPTHSDGTINIDKLLRMIDDETFLISIAACESEIGIQQDIDTIAQRVKSINPNIFVHSDITQAINKYKLSLKHLDYASFSGHKFGSLKGIGGIIKNTSTRLNPIMYGSDLKPGTKPVELIHNMTLALKAIRYQDEFKVKAFNTFLRKRFENNPLIKINTPKNASPYILNISILNKKSNVSQALLNQKNIGL